LFLDRGRSAQPIRRERAECATERPRLRRNGFVYKLGVLDRTVGTCSRADATDGREWSAMRSVARETVMGSRHSGQTGVIVLPVTPCR
jgi:hypothetical protein